MTAKNLDIAFWNYDRTRPSSMDRKDRRRRCQVSQRAHRHRNLRGHDPGPCVRRVGTGDDLLPANHGARRSAVRRDPGLPESCFRHSAIYINKEKGIERPEDLAGKTIGELAIYGHDSGVTPKGILSDDHGLTPDKCRWVIGAIDFPMKPIDFVPSPTPRTSR